METDDITNLIQGRGAVITHQIYRISGSQLNQLIAEWKKAGIREVVEWINKNLPYSVGECNALVWQAKLEEWGIKDES